MVIISRVNLIRGIFVKKYIFVSILLILFDNQVCMLKEDARIGKVISFPKDIKCYLI